MGDYIGCASGNGKAWAFWMDDKAGSGYNAWAGYITTGPPPVNDIVVGPFQLTGTFVAGTIIRLKKKKRRTANQTNVPTRFSVNGGSVQNGTISLPAGIRFGFFHGSILGTYILRIFKRKLMRTG
jgi:hypothetical protein